MREDRVDDRLGRLAEWSAALRYEDLPAAAVEQAKLQLLDHLGSGIAGAELPGSDAILAAAEGLGEAGEATILLDGRRTSAFAACLVNGAFISQPELTVGIGRAIVHPGTQALPVLLAESERRGTSGREILVAFVVAYEVLIRIGWALTHVPGEPLSIVRPQLTTRGWYAPSVLGAFGAAAAAARARGLDAGLLLEAFGICGNLAPTTLHAGAREGPVKALGEGWATATGLFAVDLAEQGFTGVRQIAEHLFPLLVGGADKVDFERIDAGLGERLEFLDFGGNQTMFSASRISSIPDCAVELTERQAVDPGEVTDVLVETMTRFRSLDDPDPPNRAAARFSIPYCVAQVLSGRGRDDLLEAAFDEPAFDDPAWRDLARKVRVEVNQEFDSDFESYPRRSSSSRITVTMRDGATVQHRVTGAFGMLGGRPATSSDFERKFRHLAARRLPEGNADAVIRIVADLERQPDARDLVALCTREPAGTGSTTRKERVP